MFRFFSGLFMGIAALFHIGTASPTTSSFTTQQTQAGSHSQVASLHQATSATTQVVLTQNQILDMATNKYANGLLPLGDKKFVTQDPKIGYVYLCNAQADPSGGGAQKAGNWIHGNYWNINEKISVEGKVNWPNASFKNSVLNDIRTLSGNDLPSHTTGIFPISSSDPASAYDKNPNSIQTQSFSDMLPTAPQYSDTPYCMGGEAGIMLTGVALFNGFDAGLRDAAAYEVQDSCNGHPQVSGEYHYHSLSSCITDVSETTVIGYALDGFPITGSKVAPNKYLTTDNLDVCHGITSQIIQEGKVVTTYHYVMTEDFPYSVSCFRAKPVQMQVLNSNGRVGSGNQNQPTGRQAGPLNTQRPQPPQAAITACSGQTTGVRCSFTGPSGTISGTCQTPPGQTNIVCVPSGQSLPQAQGQQPPQY